MDALVDVVTINNQLLTDYSKITINLYIRQEHFDCVYVLQRRLAAALIVGYTAVIHCDRSP